MKQVVAFGMTITKKMSKKQNIGKWLVGIGAALAFISRQKLSVAVKSVYLNGIATSKRVPLRVVVYLMNRTIASVLIRNISGALISNGMTVATINQDVNKRMPANSTTEQSVLVDIHSQEALKALIDNMQSGDINNLSFDFVGEVVVGEQWPVGIKFNKLFTWQDIKRMV